jgi:hypothetical protein
LKLHPINGGKKIESILVWLVNNQNLERGKFIVELNTRIGRLGHPLSFGCVCFIQTSTMGIWRKKESINKWYATGFV